MKGIWAYSEFWHTGESGEMITMGEGHTPLIPARRLGEKYGLDHLYFKLETTNPSGSYKDRFAAAAVSHLLSMGAKVCLATSSGNTGSALAAYCARAGLPCFVIVVDGTPPAKLEQMQIYGAHTLMVKGFGLDEKITSSVFEQLRLLSENFNAKVQISAYTYSPEGMRGVETIGLELAADQEVKNEVQVFAPAGGGGLTLAIGRGFQTWKINHPEYVLPALHCVQPDGNNTIAGSLKHGKKKAASIVQSTTNISGLQVPGVIDGNETLAICRSLGGTGHLVDDEMVFQLQAELASMEGIYCEPAGAVALAGAIQACQNQKIKKSDQVVCMITGHGFKDTGFLKRVSTDQNKYFDQFDSVEEYVRKIIKGEGQESRIMNQISNK